MPYRDFKKWYALVYDDRRHFRNDFLQSGFNALTNASSSSQISYSTLKIIQILRVLIVPLIGDIISLIFMNRFCFLNISSTFTLTKHLTFNM